MLWEIIWQKLWCSDCRGECMICLKIVGHYEWIATRSWEFSHNSRLWNSPFILELHLLSLPKRQKITLIGDLESKWVCWMIAVFSPFPEQVQRSWSCCATLSNFAVTVCVSLCRLHVTAVNIQKIRELLIFHVCLDPCSLRLFYIYIDKVEASRNGIMMFVFTILFLRRKRSNRVEAHKGREE